MIASLFSDFGSYVIGGVGILAAMVAAWFGIRSSAESAQKADDAVAQEAASVEQARVASAAVQQAAASVSATNSAVASLDDPAVTKALAEFTRDMPTSSPNP